MIPHLMANACAALVSNPHGSAAPELWAGLQGCWASCGVWETQVFLCPSHAPCMALALAAAAGAHMPGSAGPWALGAGGSSDHSTLGADVLRVVRCTHPGGFETLLKFLFQKDPLITYQGWWLIPRRGAARGELCSWFALLSLTCHRWHCEPKLIIWRQIHRLIHFENRFLSCSYRKQHEFYSL